MDSASSRVFGLPELASVIASYLNKKALTQVMLTSRQMHAAVEPWFYHDLRTYYQYLMTKDLAVSFAFTYFIISDVDQWVSHTNKAPVDVSGDNNQPPSTDPLGAVEFREYETGESEIELPSDWSSFSDVEDALIDAFDAGTFESAAVVASAMVAAESLSRGPINGPFVNLRDLQLESCMEKATLEQALSIFKSCPNLETLVLTEFFVPGGLDGADVGRMCPNLHTLRLDGIGQMTDDILWPLGIMTTLPKDRMEILKACVGGPYQWLNGIVASKTILRHSGSLREIYACSRTASEAMGLILGTCEVLEVLEICCSAVSLEDAVASPWASTKIHHDLPAVYFVSPRHPVYGLLPPHTAPGTIGDENHLFAQLDVFYRQVGKQERLRYLNLTRARRSENGLVAIENSAKQKSLPGMLRLGGDNSNIGGSMNRPGFLHLLGGLSKLEVIKGLAVCPETEDGRMPADVMEVEWIRVHWPLLQETGFSASKRPQENFLYL
ncbi:hypothetical protein BGZ97_005741 [Linnemannia gamsii]|uniref:F-box domain-containing protein n=1 Tax=Linnemannia gamsii TaxID=64522 RepID=A0A9P6USF0_9FUNG|nr:hypothetical protein BGZ97_005741 [Linnemannia gamsii]